MPVIIPKKLPAYDILSEENLPVIDDSTDIKKSSDIIDLAIVNLMPTKEKTETQLLRRLAVSPYNINVDFIRTGTYEGKNTASGHLESFYTTFDDIRSKKYDGMIITGAPVENLQFEDVKYWNEIEDILEFSRENVHSTMFICWASQAALYHFFGIEKYSLPEKLFGVYECGSEKNSSLMYGFENRFFVPHSRHTYTKIEDVKKIDSLEILSCSEKAGLNIAASKDRKFLFITGHGEYDTDTLEQEYLRDLEKGLDIKPPENYYKDNDINNGIQKKWNAHSTLLFSNWINNWVRESGY